MNISQRQRDLIAEVKDDLVELSSAFKAVGNPTVEATLMSMARTLAEALPATPLQQ